ncbi:MAG TPA: hypothetical protein VN420_03660 [Candidatus Fimivivens sp.]|nr:hypothetical protein [Candidatus Fimivivens sp.]
MTPSKEMTQRQIDEAVANYRALLEKHVNEFDAAAAQRALGQSELADEQFAAFRRRVEMFSNLIVRRTKVNRRLSSRAALAATGRKQHTDDGVMNGMPFGGDDEVDVVFFYPELWEYTRPGFMSDDDLEKALARRGLENDPRAVIAANAADPLFADNHPNGAHWKDASGAWCFLVFDRWDGQPCVDVGSDARGWFNRSCYCGTAQVASCPQASIPVP